MTLRSGGLGSPSRACAVVGEHLPNTGAPMQQTHLDWDPRHWCAPLRRCLDLVEREERGASSAGPDDGEERLVGAIDRKSEEVL